MTKEQENRLLEFIKEVYMESYRRGEHNNKTFPEYAGELIKSLLQKADLKASLKRELYTGYVAYFAGKLRTDNPHTDKTTNEARAWDGGYCSASGEEEGQCSKT